MAKNFKILTAYRREARRWEHMSNKVQKGTPNHSEPSKCDSCSNSVRIRGQAESQEHVYCRSLEKTINFKVAECSAYREYGKPSLYDMQQIAWPLCTDKNGKRIGFLAPQELRKRKDDVIQVGFDSETLHPDY